MTAHPFNERQVTNILARFAANEDGCWLWKGYLSKGYGVFGWREAGTCRSMAAHRAVWLLLRGTLDPELPLDHLCRVRNCVNPDHLEPVTHRENILRGIGPSAKQAAQNECHRGHAFTAENTRNEKDGSRRCRTCQREDARTRRASSKPVVRRRPRSTCDVCGHEMIRSNLMRHMQRNHAEVAA